MSLQEIYDYMVNKKSDINEHLPTLVKYGIQCSHITEMGVRTGRSTTAWMMSKPSRLVCYDLKVHKDFPLQWYSDWASENGINFSFVEGNTLKVDIEDTDLLFIDTLHNYDQLKVELARHADKVRKFIILHDTETFGYKGETKGHEGLQLAVDEFLEKGDWCIKEIYRNNNGLTILNRM